MKGVESLADGHALSSSKVGLEETRSMTSTGEKGTKGGCVQSDRTVVHGNFAVLQKLTCQSKRALYLTGREHHLAMRAQPLHNAYLSSAPPLFACIHPCCSIGYLWSTGCLSFFRPASYDMWMSSRSAHGFHYCLELLFDDHVMHLVICSSQHSRAR